jgi:hypothetical protein
MPPNHLTEKAKWHFDNPARGKMARPITGQREASRRFARSGCLDGLAAPYAGGPPNLLIVIEYGE